MKISTASLAFWLFNRAWVLGPAVQSSKMCAALLSRVRYYVYYRATGDALEVLAFWHTSRGRQPPL